MFRKMVKLHHLKHMILGYSRPSYAKCRLKTWQLSNFNSVLNGNSMHGIQTVSFSTNQTHLRFPDKVNGVNCVETTLLNEDDIIQQDSELRSFLDDIMKDFNSAPQPPKPPGSKASSVESEDSEELNKAGNATEQSETRASKEVEESSKTGMRNLEQCSSPQQIESNEMEINGAFRQGAFSLDYLVNLLRDENLKEIAVIKVPQQLAYCDFMVIATAISYRHLNAVAEHLRKVHKSLKNRKENYLTIEGQNCKDWKVLDMGNIVLHLFTYEVRDHYDIETLWTVGEKYDDLSNKPTDEMEILLNENSYYFGTGEAVAVKTS